MNKVLLTGRLTKDIELRQTNSGKSVVQTSIAVKREFKENGEYNTDFINVVVWGASADFLKSYAKKGDLIEVVGRWQVRNYQDSQGLNRQANECVAENVNILAHVEPKPAVESNNDGLPSFDANDLPF